MAKLRFVTGGALAGGLFEGLMQQGREEHPTLEPGTVIGRFRIERLIDQGGAASVYQAERCDEAFRQSVALKITHKPIADATHLAHEHNALGRLRHPVIATILDGGALDDGRAWMAIELVDGVPLDDWCRQARPGWRARVSLVCRIADGLVYAHGRGVAHCDIKPDNVLVTHEGEPKLIDFGIAAEAGGLAPAMSTPGFASPEQRAGQPGSPLSDIFQLGLLLDLLIRPSDEPVPDIARDRARMASLGAIVDKATQPMAEHRYASVADMRRDLQNVLADRPVHARRNSPATIAYWSLRRNARAAAVGVVLLIVLAGAITYYRDSISSSYLQRDQARQSANLAQDFLGQVLQIASAGDRNQAIYLIDRTAARVNSAERIAPMQYAQAIETLAAAYLSLGQSPQAAALLEQALARIPSGYPLDRTDLFLMKARVHAFDSDLPRARESMTQAERFLASSGRSRDPLKNAGLNATRAEVADAANEPIAALRLSDRAIRELDRIKARQSDEYTRALLILARSQHRLGRFSQANQTYERALRLANGFHGPSAAIALDIEREAIFNQLMHGNDAGAKDSLDRQNRYIRALHGTDSFEYARLLSSYGTWAGSRGRCEEATSHFREQIALLEKLGTQKPSSLPNALHNLGDCLFDLGRYGEAASSYRRANALRNARGLDDGVPRSIALLKEVAATCELDRPAEALSRFPEVNAALRASHPRGHRTFAMSDVLHAGCLMRNGRVDDARRLFVAARRKLDTSEMDVLWQRRIARYEQDLGLVPVREASRSTRAR